MSRPNLTWAYNSGVSDAAWSSAPNEGQNFVVIDLSNDKILFLDADQMDGDDIGATRYPIVIPTSGSLEAPKTFVSDYSADILDQVPLAGTTAGEQSGGNTRYVFAIYFSGATAGIPTLEAWNTSAHAASDDAFLGGGVTADSTIRAIGTTNAAPGSATWSGTPLAGSGSAVNLDAEALTAAKALYFNLKQLIPYTFEAQSNSDIVLTCRFLYS